MPRFELQTEIAAPADEVFEYVLELRAQPGVAARRRATATGRHPRPVGVGSTYEQVTNFMGKEIAATFEVVEYEPGRRVRVECREARLPADGRAERRAEGRAAAACTPRWSRSATPASTRSTRPCSAPTPGGSSPPTIAGCASTSPRASRDAA